MITVAATSGEPDPRLVGIAHDRGALASWQVGSIAEATQAIDDVFTSAR
jgi:hypothetical protein